MKKGNKGGRPPKYKKIYCKKLIEFFDIDPISVRTEKFYYKNGDEKEKEIEVAATLPTFARFAHSIKVDEDTLLNWSKKHKEFFGAYKKAKKLQEDIWQVNSLKGLYSAPFAIFMGKNVYGWKDKQETEHSGKVIWKEEAPK